MPIVSDVRGYADTAVSQGKIVLTQVGVAVQGMTGALSTLISDAPPPSHLALGVADLAAEAVSRRAEAATERVDRGPRPLDARLASSRRAVDPRLLWARLTQRQEDAVAAIARAQEGAQATLADVRSRLKDRPARAAVQLSFGRARDAYGTINVRGEKRAAALAKDDRLAKLISDFDGASETVQAKFLPILDAISVRAAGLITQPGTPPPSSDETPTTHDDIGAGAPAADKPTAKSAAKTAKKTPVVADPVKVTPAKKAQAGKVAAKQVPAKKPPVKKAAKAPVTKAT
jgi:hypothetical protein